MDPETAVLCEACPVEEEPHFAHSGGMPNRSSQTDNSVEAAGGKGVGAVRSEGRGHIHGDTVTEDLTLGGGRTAPYTDHVSQECTFKTQVI